MFRKIAFVALIVLAAISGVLVAKFIVDPPQYTPVAQSGGMVVSNPRQIPDYALVDMNGQPFKLSQLRGRSVLIFFGYTFCPDICPATLANVGQALRDLGSRADDIQVIMVSLDPERDTPEKLSDYVDQFHPSMIGITGTKEKLDEVASLYGIFYQKAEGSDATRYLIDHTATLLVLDREGYLKLVFPFGVTSQEIADDLKYMLRQ